MTIKKTEGFLINISLLVFLLFEFFAGPLRWFFHLIGMEVLFSIPKGLIILTEFVVLANIFYNKKITKNGFFALVVLTYSFIISIINSELTSILVGLWGIIPLFLGYHAATTIFNTVKNSKANRIVYILYIISCFGIFLNMAIDYPWYDITYEIAGMDVSSAAIGSTGGYTRYAGFLKSSLQASANIFIVLLYIIATTRSKMLIMIFFLMSLAVSVVTISKTAFVLHLVLLAYLLIKFLPVKLLWRGTILFTIIATVLTIISTDFSFEMNSDPLSVMLLGSLNARLTITWPESIKAILQSGNMLFGGGLGTLGVGSKMNTVGYNPGDSMYLYLIATGGYILGGLLVIWAYFQSSVLTNSELSRFVSIILIMLCLFGVSMTVPEYPMMGLAFGMIMNTRTIRKIEQRT